MCCPGCIVPRNLEWAEQVGCCMHDRKLRRRTKAALDSEMKYEGRSGCCGHQALIRRPVKNEPATELVWSSSFRKKVRASCKYLSGVFLQNGHFCWGIETFFVIFFRQSPKAPGKWGKWPMFHSIRIICQYFENTVGRLVGVIFVTKGISIRTCNSLESCGTE